MNWKIFTIILSTALYTSAWWALAYFGFWWGGEHTKETSFPGILPAVFGTMGVIAIICVNAVNNWNDK